MRTGTIPLILFILIIPTGVSAVFLDESNVLGSPGDQYWNVAAPGDYFLTFSSDTISTNHNYAIRIVSSDVILDGMGKNLTGPGIGSVEPGPSYYGIRVNSGTITQNVTVKNVSIQNKNLAIVYEWVSGGGIQSVHCSSNTQGITTWNSSNLTVQANIVNSNTHGIVLDGHAAKNDFLVVDSNNAYGNSQFGIHLWLTNNNNSITNNQANFNNMGVVFTDGGTGNSGTNNTLSRNTVIGNVNGIYFLNYSGNSISYNTINGNTNVGMWFDRSGSNNFTRNSVNGTGWVGIYLGGSSSGNIVYDNIFQNTDNEETDGTSPNTRWNITPVSGRNLVNGPSIGGNYWTNPSGLGYSDTCSDGNSDGFCDTPYTHTGGITDYYPLHKWVSTGQGVGIYRPLTHMFYLRTPGSPTTAIDWGVSTDLPVTGDWNGNGITDVGIYRPSTHMFYLRTPGSPTTAIDWGVGTDLPVTGDWNGNGITDVGIYRPSTHMFYLRTPGSPTTAIDWGVSTDLPVTGDWNGNGITDVGIYRPSTHMFYLRIPGSPTTAIDWGVSTDLPVTGDWNGNGITDVGIYRPSTHMFYLRTPGSPTTAIDWGVSTDLPVTGRWL
ncbi:NosD domain-containing protein [Methanoregula sp. PtaB.Bin085]|uniref:right-handed parallel beta-helix repeat-containing protein n=1 Tax=Methanoregula sp. PtaB.Bin085 TaxID=1811680 RepID=UPI00341C3D52